MARRSSLQEHETLSCLKFSEKTKAYKNILGQCTSFILGFAPFLGLINLQSSVNERDGLGLTTSAVSYASTMLMLLFVPGFVRVFGSKYSLITSYVLLLLYTCCNFYPDWFTLIPIAAMNGFSLGVLYVSMYTHATSIALKYAPTLQETTQNVIILFSGAVGSSIQIAMMSGSSISSVVLFNLDIENATTDVNSSLCTNKKASHLANNNIYFMLLGIYLIMNVSGIVIATVFMDHLGSDAQFISPTNMCNIFILNPVKTLFKTLCEWKMLLLMPMFILEAVMLGFIHGGFTKVIVSDCVGVQWIGFALTAFGLSGSLGSLIIGRMISCIPQFIAVYGSFLLTVGLAMFLIFWERKPSFFVVFGFAIGWGLAECVLMTLGPGISAFLFPDRREQALTCYRLGMCIGYVTSFTVAIYLDISEQLWLTISFVGIATVTYTSLGFMTWTRQQVLPCLSQKDDSNEVPINVKTKETIDEGTNESNCVV